MSYLYINNFFTISVIFKAHTWISCSDNKMSYLCFTVQYLLNMFYCSKILVFFALSDGYICFCLNTYLHPSCIILFEVGCLLLCWLYIYIYIYIYTYILIKTALILFSNYWHLDACKKGFFFNEQIRKLRRQT